VNVRKALSTMRDARAQDTVNDLSPLVPSIGKISLSFQKVQSPVTGAMSVQSEQRKKA